MVVGNLLCLLFLLPALCPLCTHCNQNHLHYHRIFEPVFSIRFMWFLYFLFKGFVHLERLYCFHSFKFHFFNLLSILQTKGFIKYFHFDTLASFPMFVEIFDYSKKMSFVLILIIFQDILSYFSFIRVKEINIPPLFSK